MGERNAVLAALNALGEKIIALESARETQKMYREIAESKVATLQAENDRLNRTLARVQNYADRMEEQ